MADELDTPVEPDGGQVVEAPVLGQAEPFFTDHDGTVFNNSDDLAKAHKESFMRQSDYTRKTQTLSDDRRQLDTERDDIRRAIDELKGKSSQYEKYDRFLKERPDVLQELDKRLRAGPTPPEMYNSIEKMVDEKYGSKFEEFEQWKANQDQEEKRVTAFSELSGQYEDFDGDKVLEYLKEISGGDMKTLGEALYFSLKGKTNPAAMEQSIQEKLGRKKGARLVPGSGSTPASGERDFGSIDEARNAAMKDLT